MGYHQNRLDWPVKIFYLFSFLTSPVSPGPLWRVLVASQRAPKRDISRIQPKPGLWGIIGIVLTSQSKFFDFFVFLTSPVLPGTLRRVPAASQQPHKRVISRIQAGHGLWGIIEIVSTSLSNFFDFFLYFRPHLSPQDPFEGSWQPPKMVFSRIQPKPGLCGIIGIVLTSPSTFSYSFQFLTSTMPPGPLRRVQAAVQKDHFQNRTKTQVVGYQQNLLDAPVIICTEHFIVISG